MLLFIPINGYDVCRDNMLDMRCVCSGASISAVECIWFVTKLPQKDLILSRALFGEMNVSKNDVRSLCWLFGPMHIELMCGRSWLYLLKHWEVLLDSVSNKLAIDMCRFIGVVMSLFNLNPCEIYLRQVIILMTKSGAALVLALMIPRPPLLTFRCVMSVENVGISSDSGISRRHLKKELVMLSIPCVKCPFQLYHCSLSNSGV